MTTISTLDRIRHSLVIAILGCACVPEEALCRSIFGKIDLRFRPYSSTDSMTSRSSSSMAMSSTVNGPGASILSSKLNALTKKSGTVTSTPPNNSILCSLVATTSAGAIYRKGKTRVLVVNHSRRGRK